jgi:hypothetical protein
MAQTRKQKVLQEVKRKRKQRTIISLVIAAILVSIIGVGIYVFAMNAGKGTNFPFPCLAENTTLHIHPWLRILIQTTPGGLNDSITIPTAVGILDPELSNGLAGGGSCFEPLHTHDDSGIIHVESAHTTDKYTLGDFFDVWKATPGYATIPAADTDTLGPLPVVFNSTDILGFRPDQTHTMSLLVDQGQSTYQNSTAYGSLSLIPLDYCSTAVSSSFPCSATAGGDPYFGGATYPYGTGHTIIIYYKAV